jgi:putative flippase GtrA
MRRQFARYLVVGAFLGVATLIVRAIGEHLLPESRVGYFVSVIIAYSMGTVAGFFMHARYTFKHSLRRLLPRQFFRFVAVAFGQVAVVSVFATVLRYSTALAQVNAELAGAISLAIAVIIAAVATFLLNRVWVYN